MSTTLIDSSYQQYRSLLDEVFKSLHDLTIQVDDKQLGTTVNDLRTQLHEPFLFVIVGEVKVGKSSFVNALLESEKEICKVAPDPCTDTVQQIVYGTEESTIVINPHLKKITLPIDILKKIAIVDTPGTNAVIEQHQEITERFIPVSDLIIFVFEAKNPYRQSAWEFFNLINKEWRKKVVFVLQQADLMDEEDLQINIKGVRDHAIKQGIAEPQVFALSAKKELKKESDSGFKPMREFVRQTITGGNNIRMKIQSLMVTSGKIMDTVDDGLSLRRAQLKKDSAFRDNVNQLLDGAQDKTASQTDELVTELLEEYDTVTGEIQKDFERGLGVVTLLKKSIFSLFDRSQSIEEWMETITERFDKDLRPALEKKLREGIKNIAESVKQMAEIIDKEIRKNRGDVETNNTVFSAISEKRHDKMEELQNNIEDLIDETEKFLSDDMTDRSSSLIPNMYTGGALAVLGGILAGVTSTMAFDITGGVLAAIGLSVAGVITVVQRGRIVKEFEEEIAKGRGTLEEEVQRNLGAYVKEIRTKIDNNFLEFDAFVNKERSNLAEVTESFNEIQQKFDGIKKDLSL